MNTVCVEFYDVMKVAGMVKRLVRLLVIAGLAGGLLGVAGCENREAGQVVRLETSTVRLGGEVFRVELAYRQATRARGLMYREELGGIRGCCLFFGGPVRSRSI